MANFYRSARGERLVKDRYREILEYWPVAHEQLRVPTREGETFVISSGRAGAPAVLLLHGSMFNSAMWMREVRIWAPHLRVHCIDIIGEAGLSAQARPPLPSEAHALWVDDVLRALSLTRASFVGISLGGWLALDYAIRRPERLEKLALLAPGGIAPNRNVSWRLLPLMLAGRWGIRKAMEHILGRLPPDAPQGVQYVWNFMALIFENLRPRTAALPVFSDQALSALRMPVLAILGARDTMVDSTVIRERLAQVVPHALIRFLADAGHDLGDQSQSVLEFLSHDVHHSRDQALPRSQLQSSY